MLMDGKGLNGSARLRCQARFRFRCGPCTRGVTGASDQKLSGSDATSAIGARPSTAGSRVAPATIAKAEASLAQDSEDAPVAPGASSSTHNFSWDGREEDQKQCTSASCSRSSHRPYRLGWHLRCRHPSCDISPDPPSGGTPRYRSGTSDSRGCDDSDQGTPSTEPTGREHRRCPP